MDLPQFFNETFLSDFTLLFRTFDGKELDQISIHGVLFAFQSPYFKTRLNNWPLIVPGIVDLIIDENVLPAAKRMVQCAYNVPIPEESFQSSELLECMVLADQYQMHHVVNMCQAKFVSLFETGNMSWDQTMNFFHLPAGLADVPSFAKLIANAYTRIKEAFCRDFEKDWQEPDLRKIFLQLPFESIKIILAHDDLCVLSENCLFIALSEWISIHPDLNASQRNDLVQMVRYPHMTGTFFTNCVSKHPLFRSHPHHTLFSEEVIIWNTAQETLQDHLLSCVSNDHQRFVRRALPTEPEAEFIGAFKLDDIRSAISNFERSRLKDVQALYSSEYQRNGFTFKLKLEVRPPDFGSWYDRNIHFGLCWGIKIDKSSAVMPNAHLVADFSLITFDEEGEEDATATDGEVVVRAGHCFGFDDFFGPEVYDDPNAWNKYADSSGNVLIKCRIENCY